jgi:hypothetical protein
MDTFSCGWTDALGELSRCLLVKRYGSIAEMLWNLDTRHHNLWLAMHITCHLYHQLRRKNLNPLLGFDHAGHQSSDRCLQYQRKYHHSNVHLTEPDKHTQHTKSHRKGAEKM